MKTSLRTAKAFTLVEIMTVVVIIGLLAAIAIPVFQKIRQNALRAEMVNDGRQIGAAAQHYMMENQLNSVDLVIGSDGRLGAPLNLYIKQVSRNYSASSTVGFSGSFTLAHPLVKGGFDGQGAFGSPVAFNSEGQLYAE